LGLIVLICKVLSFEAPAGTDKLAGFFVELGVSYPRERSRSNALLLVELLAPLLSSIMIRSHALTDRPIRSAMSRQ
jgi:hypothetical protein